VWKVAGLKRGDLVFWANTYKPGVSHAGIYVGGGRAIMAHGSGSRASSTDIRSGYYMSHFAWGVRPKALRR
jgi:cell wall-associated NlpC family hydrolase